MVGPGRPNTAAQLETSIEGHAPDKVTHRLFDKTEGGKGICTGQIIPMILLVNWPVCLDKYGNVTFGVIMW